MDDFVIRLWRRVGTIRAVLGLVIIAGLVGGLVIAGLQTQHDASANPVKVADAASPLSSSSATPSVSRPPVNADEADALAKAKDAASDASAQAKAADDAARKKAEEAASRSNQRTTAASPSASASTKPPTNSPPKYPVPSSCDAYSGNKKIGCAVLVGYGFGLDQMPCLEKLWDKESHWNASALNKSSGAYGIPQALPGNKMATVGADWKTNPETQIRWGLNYIKGRYSTPCGAWSHSQSKGWY
ncbi:lytic transglycosylase domain-containing protein [Dactylosporangium sp. NPDC000555]|uniref:aggregation-promoting factor C-terminal-like domain-containing protein n=1 Tax=Dactylosporangium sp. NPDC000555 TaxID=3154260 RepID=UPI003324BDF3